MNILAFDCAGAQCAAALCVDGRVAAARGVRADRGHAQLLAPMLRDVLAEAGLRFQDIDRFAVTTGPGSFTGIRVALAMARGLTLATGRPTIGVSSFEAHAAAAKDGSDARPILEAIESRRAECFLQLFDPAGAPLRDPAMLRPDDIAAWLGAGAVVIAGDAARSIAPFLPEATPARREDVDPAIVAALAAGRAVGKPPAPFYLRPPDAVPSRQGP